MLFNSLSKLKRTMVMMIICLLFTGLTMFAVPVSYIPILGKALGFSFLVLAILKILDFITSKKAMINYISLTLGLLSGLIGILLFAIDGLFLGLLNWLTGTLPILCGLVGMFHALVYARRSGRKGWWLLIILNSLLLLFGTILFTNPWADDPRAVLQVIGGTLFYSAVVYVISLFWIWPFRTENGWSRTGMTVWKSGKRLPTTICTRCWMQVFSTAIRIREIS